MDTVNKNSILHLQLYFIFYEANFNSLVTNQYGINFHYAILQILIQ